MVGTSERCLGDSCGGAARRRRFANERLRNRNHDRARVLNWACQLGGRRTAGGVVTQASLYRCPRMSGGSVAGRQVVFGSFLGPGKALGEGLDHGDAETPDIAGRGKPAVLGFGRIVQGGDRDAYPGFAGGTDGITGQFQLIIDHQKVCRLQLALHQVLAVQESQGVQGGKEHFPHFIGRQGPVGKHLSESLFGVFHYDEEKLGRPPSWHRPVSRSRIR